MVRIIRAPEKFNGFGRVRTRELGYRRPALVILLFITILLLTGSFLLQAIVFVLLVVIFRPYLETTIIK